MDSDNGQPEAVGNGLVGFLEPHAISTGIGKDVALARRAFVENWPMPPERRRRLMTILMQIAEADTFEVEKVVHEPGRNGEGIGSEKRESLRMPNHRNQIAAAKAILVATGQDQADLHHIEDLAAGKSSAPGSTTNILVLNIPPPRALEAAESPPSP